MLPGSRALLAALLLVALPVICAADVVVMMDGTQYKGELRNKKALSDNPLRPRIITILVTGNLPATQRLLTLDAVDIRTIIMEMAGAQQTIELAELRAQEAERRTQDMANQLEQDKSETIRPLDEPFPEPQRYTDPQLQRKRRMGVGFTALGAALVAIGAAVDTEDGLDAVNVALIVGGATAIGYGAYQIGLYRSSKRDWQLGLQLRPAGDVAMLTAWRF